MIIHLEKTSFDKFVQGDERIFGVVYERLRMPLYVFAYSIVRQKHAAEDIVAEALLKLWQNREKMQQASHIQHFAFATVRNLALDLQERVQEKMHRRARAGGMRPLGDMIEEGQTARELEQAEISYILVMKAIEEAARQLPSKRQRIFRLHFMEGKGVEEIAQTMGLARSTVYNQLSAACDQVRHKLKVKELEDEV